MPSKSEGKEGRGRASLALVREWRSTYLEWREALWGEIVFLNSNAFIMDKIAQFPFDLFESHNPLLWNCVFESMTQTCTSIICKITTDSDKDVLTLKKLKNGMLSHFVKDEDRVAFLDRLRELNFDKRFSPYESTFTEERHKRIAHFNARVNVSPSNDDLRRRAALAANLNPACDLINGFFDVLCLGHLHAKAWGDYNPGILFPPDMDSRTDIERILDQIAKDSPLLNMPEREPNFWPMYKDNLSEVQMQTLNTYRAKFNLPPVD